MKLSLRFLSLLLPFLGSMAMGQVVVRSAIVGTSANFFPFAGPVLRIHFHYSPTDFNNPVDGIVDTLYYFMDVPATSADSATGLTLGIRKDTSSRLTTAAFLSGFDTLLSNATLRIVPGQQVIKIPLSKTFRYSKDSSLIVDISTATRMNQRRFISSLKPGGGGRVLRSGTNPNLFLQADLANMHMHVLVPTSLGQERNAAALAAVRLFPNPATQQATLLNLPEGCALKLVSADGRSHAATLQGRSLQLGHLPAGLYHLVLQHGSSLRSMSLMKE